MAYPKLFTEGTIGRKERDGNRIRGDGIGDARQVGRIEGVVRSGFEAAYGLQ